jgi:predicted ABC-type ATPase
MTPEPNPRVYVIAGPNGAGKTTFAREFLPHFVECDEFVNADLIAAGLSPFAPQREVLRAGRLVLERIHELSERRATFAFETTLAGLGYIQLLKRFRKRGYAVHAKFLYIPSVEMAEARVAARVRAGGHDVPVAEIRRRFGRGIRNFFGPYSAVFDTWEVWDTSDSVPRLVAFHDDEGILVSDPAAFDSMRREAQVA